MKKINVVKNNRDFDAIIKNGYFKKNEYFVIYICDNGLDIYRIGLSVGKKIGNAVLRNHYKRVLRNVCDNNKKLYSKGKDYIIIMRKACTLLSYQDLEDSLVHLIAKLEKDYNNEKKN